VALRTHACSVETHLDAFFNKLLKVHPAREPHASRIPAAVNCPERPRIGDVGAWIAPLRSVCHVVDFGANLEAKPRVADRLRRDVKA